MLTSLYSIYDSKVETFHPPFTAINNRDAKRMILSKIKQMQFITQFPEDFRLTKIGTMDNTTGKLKTEETPRHIIEILALINLQEEKESRRYNGYSDQKTSVETLPKSQPHTTK